MDPKEIASPLPTKKRKYTGPPKGSDEAKERMERVRAAQWAKNGLVQSSSAPSKNTKNAQQ